MSESMRIVAFKAENFKRIRVVEIRPDGSVVILRGENEQGKTSCLDGIAATLGGERLCPATPIRIGEEEAITSVDLGDLVATRRWRWNTDKTKVESLLTLKSAEGARFPSPQTVLDKLVGKIAFDPLEFCLKYDAKQQLEVVRKLVGIDFTTIDAERKDKYEERTVIGRDVAILKGAVAKMPEVEGPAQETSLKMLLEEQQRLLAHQSSNEAKKRAVEKSKAALDRRAETIQGYKKEIAALEKRLAECRATLATAEQEEKQAKLEVEQAETVVKELVDPDIAAITKQISEAEQTNRRAREKAARAVEVAKLEKKEAAVKALTERIDKIDEIKASTLRQAKFPIEGLSFDDQGVTLKGLPLSEASGAQRIKLSLAIGFALNPKLKVLLIRDASLLDQKSLAMVGEMAKEAGAQVWLEMVGKSGASGIIIEDGEVEAVLPEPAEARA